MLPTTYMIHCPVLHHQLPEFSLPFHYRKMVHFRLYNLCRLFKKPTTFVSSSPSRRKNRSLYSPARHRQCTRLDLRRARRRRCSPPRRSSLLPVRRQRCSSPDAAPRPDPGAPARPQREPPFHSSPADADAGAPTPTFDARTPSSTSTTLLRRARILFLGVHLLVVDRREINRFL
jgi:hypothetical protein